MLKTDSIIIDLRDQIPWHKRYLSNTGTLMLWFFWILLWQPIAMALGLIEVRHQRFVDQVLDAFFTVVEHGLISIAIFAVVLWLWTHCLPSKAVKHTQAKSMQDYAEHYQIDVQSIHRARQQKIVTVYHDESGKIQRVE
ncbi:poly-beta-1,6-N-acetyl-D-glucosamine biosynthesis protein PgaD [Acinetobacter shaoyimingii]|uniref:Poly-beta-1,6-N-acetyl-D-glucosamine biosynthesis protein PgaD n=1 Tax=Acinetobacter shaoyimingii TaxID=2715164 RepID=A0A6G8RXW8_9GAMM|nr:poly-beta-1,6-N-acetyl-D-glucosamine biosynthesis protein PgaD [Acinetobacter shaoyimingii]NHB57651.1 poly-beta-1,6-N-acetyl-D-glucosamine biosynthesis protein PgaD [Acinetobacter shaoyimingii]QIO06648.1 poly-beta-1,6-N-acetyl-D-glucosamine biosynthesis protein PgaD [Acinetobacter shaoyimingii]